MEEEINFIKKGQTYKLSLSFFDSYTVTYSHHLAKLEVGASWDVSTFNSHL